MTEQTVPLRLPAEAASELLYAEALETRPSGSWTPERSGAASRDALAVAGESASDEALLVTRARLVLSRMREDDPGLRVPEPPSGSNVLLRAAALVLILLGFISGALTDRIASSGATVSLLSPPCLAVILWNLAAGLLALLSLCRRGSSAGATACSAAQGLLKAAAFRLPPRFLGPKRQPQVLARWLAGWTAAHVPQAAWFVRSALHLAALAFGTGLIASLLVRGLGTAYAATWESTWLAGRPDLVVPIVSWLYGLVPDLLPGVQPLPDAAAIAAMEAPAAAPGAPWLIRLVWLIALAVVLPRAILAGLSLLRARQEGLCLTVGFPKVRLEAIREEARNVPKRTWLILGNGDLPHPTLSGDGAPAGISVVDPWSAPDFPELPPALSSRDAVVAALDPAATPEAEVHGELLRVLRSRAGSVTLALDFSALAKRLPPERLRSRRALWEHFAAEAGVPLQVSGLDSGEDGR